jgi:hypothetical protein
LKSIIWNLELEGVDRRILFVTARGFRVMIFTQSPFSKFFESPLFLLLNLDLPLNLMEQLKGLLTLGTPRFAALLRCCRVRVWLRVLPFKSLGCLFAGRGCLRLSNNADRAPQATPFLSAAALLFVITRFVVA